jgi:hypothetical protein
MRTLAVIALGVVGVLAGTLVAAALVDEDISAANAPQRAALSARLTPAELTHDVAGIRDGTRGTFSANIWPYGEDLVVTFSLSTRRLSGPAVKAHMHTDAPHRTGPLLLTLCDSHRCNVSRKSHTGLPAGLLRTMRLLGAYVDVHTKRNPRGELRGQIEIEP